MLMADWNVHAGLVTHANGSVEVVVITAYSTSKTQILNLGTLVWRYGPHDFPFPLGYAASVPYGNTFIVIGGYNGSIDQDAIYQYEVDTGDWLLLPQHLATARRVFAATMVPDDLIHCEQRG